MRKYYQIEGFGLPLHIIVYYTQRNCQTKTVHCANETNTYTVERIRKRRKKKHETVKYNCHCSQPVKMSDKFSSTKIKYKKIIAGCTNNALVYQKCGKTQRLTDNWNKKIKKKHTQKNIERNA